MALTNCTISSSELNKVAGQAIGSDNARLIITPNDGYVVDAEEFVDNSGVIPGVLSINISNSIGANIVGNVVYVDIDLDNNYIMPSSNTDITIDIDGAATLIPITIAGDYSTLLTNSGTSQTNIAYNSSGSYGDTILLFTKVISADSGYYFNSAPSYNITHGNASNYVITYTDTLDGSNRLISRNYSISYKIQLQSEYGHHIDFTAVAEEIYEAPIEITAYSLATGAIPISGVSRTMRIFGAAGAIFNLLVEDDDNTEILSITSQAINSSGYYDAEIIFPSSVVNKVFTITLTGDLSNSFDTPQGQPSTVQLYQSLDIVISLIATHSNPSVVFTPVNNYKEFAPNTAIPEFDGLINGSISITAPAELTLLGQPDIANFTNTDYTLNGGSDIIINSANIIASAEPNTFIMSPSAGVFYAGSTDVTCAIDISAFLQTVIPPCDAGMDVAFIFDYTGSMGASIETAKAGAAAIISTIDSQSGANDYRLSLILADEGTSNVFTGDYAGSSHDYSQSSDYLSLPTSQKYVNTGLSGKYQWITAMEMFQLNNETSFTNQLSKINTANMPLGWGVGGPEPTDMAIDLVVNFNFAGSFREGVAKYVILITDITPGGNDDIYNSIDDAKVAQLTQDCIDKGIKVLVLGTGASLPVWQGLATGTGGAYNTSFNATALIDAIQNSCTY